MQSSVELSYNGCRSILLLTLVYGICWQQLLLLNISLLFTLLLHIFSALILAFFSLLLLSVGFLAKYACYICSYVPIAMSNSAFFHIICWEMFTYFLHSLKTV